MDRLRSKNGIGWIERTLIVILVLQIVAVVVLRSGVHFTEVFGFFRSFYSDVTQTAPH